jgi:hypothetical protein
MLFNPPSTSEAHYHFVKLNKMGRIYSPFSNLNHMFLKCSAFKFESYGQDLVAPERMEVLEVVSGKAQKPSFNLFFDLVAKPKPSSMDKNDWGNYLLAKLSSGKVLALKHLQEVPDCKAGDVMETGSSLGKVGSSGSLSVPGLGLSVFSDETLSKPDKIAFANVTDKEGKEHSLFYPTQSKSFGKIES